MLWARPWNKTVMNPDSGGKPPVGGTSADGRPGGKPRRRRRAKRGGKQIAAPEGSRVHDAQARSEVRRPETQEQLSPRKRKRRRARGNGQSGGSPGGSAGAQAGAAGPANADAQSGPDATSAKSANAAGHAPNAGRRKGRGKKAHQARGLQGRPLATQSHGHGKGGAGAKALQTSPSMATTGTAKPHQAKGGHSKGPAHLRHASDQPARTSSGGDQFADQRRRSQADDLYAALDLGTNNCRLLIAQPTRPGQFRVVDAFSRIVRLGEGLAATGRLSDEAMDRAVEALKICASKLASRQIRKMRLIATEACRAAANGEDFLERVTRETGLTLEIIDRETEARLAVSGCSSLVGREARSVVLFDIGGGSSEIAVIRIQDNRSSRLANHITHWTSLPVGVVTLSERHGGRDVTPTVFSAMVAEVETMLAGFDCPNFGETDGQEPDPEFHLIGTSGTVTTLAGVHLDLPRYDRRKVDGLWLSDAEVSAMQEKLLSWDFEGRATNPCIGPDRADLVLAGCAILEAIRRRWPSRRMRVADRGLREGLLTDMMADDGVWRRARGRRAEHSARSAGETHR